MRLLPLPGGVLRVRFEIDEAHLLDQLTVQLTDLLQNYSSTALDPDPLFASLEVGGSDEAPSDPALARLFPNAHENVADADAFRQLTEQGLLNRKLQDASVVLHALGVSNFEDDPVAFAQAVNADPIEVLITRNDFLAWVRTLTALRLAVAARIGLERAEDHDELLHNEETRGTVLVFDWIAAILESVLRMHATLTKEADAKPER